MKKGGSNSSSIGRREFIVLSGFASIAVMYTPAIAGEFKDRKLVAFENNTVPVLKKCDVAIAGGGFAGIAAALKFAKSGKKVVLIERRIFLGREVTSEYRPWFEMDPEQTDVPEVVQVCIEPDIKQPEKTMRRLRFDHVKRSLEDLLFKHGVEIVYASNPVQLIADGNRLQGIVIGNKSGRQAILSKLVLDCTETASIVHLSSQRFKKTKGSVEYSRTLEYTYVHGLDSKTIDVPSELGITDNKVHVQQGYLGEGHYYIDCPMEFHQPAFDALSVTNREAMAWEKSLEVAKHLYQNVSAFKEAYLTNSSYQLHGIYTSQMIDSDYAKERPLLSNKIDGIQWSAFATHFTNLFCVNEAALLDKDQTAYLKTPLGAGKIGLALSEKIDEHWPLVVHEDHVTIHKEKEQPVFIQINTIREKYSPQRGKPYGRIEIKNEDIPIVDEVDVLVAGGGTSGAPAAYTAANEGKRTMVVDMNPGFGGTGTYGGVQSYWGPGGYYGFTAAHIQKTTEINKNLSKYFKDNGKGLWSVQAKLAMWLREIRASGAQILWNSFVVGSIMDGNTIVGAIISTPYGLIAVKARIVIDATGDGDVAAFAGAPYFFGSEHNNIPLWYALRRQTEPGPTKSIFESTVDVTNVEDYTRSVHVGLRTGGKDLHDHQPYLAPRASRHILGDVLTDLTDNLTFREWEDVINIHRANTDMKGYHASDWFRIGMIPPNLPMELPFRAVTPQKVENLIIAGKAFSTRHDSAAALRMQPDLENLGGIAALAAVQAIDDKVLVRDIDVKKLQTKLVRMGLLPEKVLSREIRTRNYSAEDVRTWIRKFEPEISLKSYSNTELSALRYDPIPFVEVCTAQSAVAVPVLEEELKNSSGMLQLLIARALAMHGSESAALVIYNEIERQLNALSLPELKQYVKHSGGSTRTPPDQGAAPLCANLIYALGMTRSDLNIPVIELVSQLFVADKIDDFAKKEKGLFFYVDAVCYAAGLIGNESVIPSLKRIHSNPFLHNQSLKNGIEESHVLERLAIMELILGRALARSGSTDGYEVLIEYLDDMRAALAEFAHTTLHRVSSCDFGKDKMEWKAWLAAHKNELKPVPLPNRALFS
jgi:flavin-dependent dehydrogenase